MYRYWHFLNHVRVAVLPRSGYERYVYVFLLAISFIAYALLKSGVKAGVVGVTAVTVLCGIVFLWSYSLMLNGYKNGRTGNRKTKIITKEIAAGKQKFIIPDYHFVKLQNSGGHFGLFHDPAVYGEYYHVQAIFKRKSILIIL